MHANIVLVCGYRRTGKDSLYDILASKAPLERFKWRIYKHPNCVNETFNPSAVYIRTAFADALKREASEEYGIPLVVSDAKKDLKQFTHYKTEELVSARDIYIEWGAIRRAEDPDYWCKAALRSVDREPNEIQHTHVVTDWRFLNEAQYTKSTFLRVTTVRVYRSEVQEPPLDIESEHNLDGYATDFLLLRDESESLEFGKAVRRFPQYAKYVECETL